MFDAEKRLVVSNRRYAEMYRLPPDRVVPGMAHEELLHQRFDAGNMPIEGVSAFLKKRLVVSLGTDPSEFDVQLTDGRIVSILHQPYGDGGWVATHDDVTQHRLHQAKMRHLASHDTLTDLPNRMLFREHLDQIAERSRAGEIMGVLCVDLDHFKAVNDELGHAAGDAVLKDVGQILMGCLRDSDIVARVGGDEFAIIAGHLSNSRETAILAERIVNRIAQPLEFQGRRIKIGACVGIAVTPIDGDDGESLVRCADQALYKAKGAGRSTYRFYDRERDGTDRRTDSIDVIGGSVVPSTLADECTPFEGIEAS